MLKVLLKELEGGYLLFQILEQDERIRSAFSEEKTCPETGYKIASWDCPDLLMNNMDNKSIFLRGANKKRDFYPVVREVCDPVTPGTTEISKILQTLKWAVTQAKGKQPPSPTPDDIYYFD